VQGQKWYLVEIWEEEKGMETILPLKKRSTEFRAK
jgi:hypothetical protein